MKPFKYYFDFYNYFQTLTERNEYTVKYPNTGYTVCCRVDTYRKNDDPDKIERITDITKIQDISSVSILTES